MCGDQSGDKGPFHYVVAHRATATEEGGLESALLGQTAPFG